MQAQTERIAATLVGRYRIERDLGASPYLANRILAMYGVAGDGRFLMLKLDSQAARTGVIIVRNWLQQAKARLQ